MKKKLTLEEIFLGNSAMLGIRQISSSRGIQREVNALDVIFFSRLISPAPQKASPLVVIINPQDLNGLLNIKSRQQLPEGNCKHDVVLIIITSSHCIPESLQDYAEKNDILIAASEYDDHYLASRVLRIIREKIHEKTSLHGVIIESQGKGILITGSSGIGKTTAALGVMESNNFWIADDIAQLKKNHNNELMACGHAGIRKLLHTESTGIINIGKIINQDQIKRQTKLAAIIEVSRDDVAACKAINKKNEILGTELSCLHLIIPQDSYLSKSLLKKSIRRILRNN